MEELDHRKKERRIRAIIFNSVISIIIMVGIYGYIAPKYTGLASLESQVNATRTVLASLKSDGVDATSFSDLLARYNRKKDVSDLILSDTEKLNTILKKPAWGDYLSWLVSENAKSSIFQVEIDNNNRILWNIIPVYVNAQSANASSIGNQITLTNFVSYVEKDILGKYALESYAPLGIGSIAFSNEKKSSVNIGSFQITIDFKWRHNNIMALVDSLQKSGEVVIENGKLIPKDDDLKSRSGNNLSDLSNLLVNIKSLRLDSILPFNSVQANQGTMVLEFYVEGMDHQKILILKNVLVEKFEWKLLVNEDGSAKKDDTGKPIRLPGLRDNIKKNADLCTKPWNPLCNDPIAFNAIVSIKNLSKNIATIQSRVDTLKKNEVSSDVTKELDGLLEIKNSLESMELLYTKNADIIQKVKLSIPSK